MQEHPHPSKMELGERGDPWNSICGSIAPFAFMGKTRSMVSGDPPASLPLKVGGMQELPLTSATVRCEPYAFIARDQKGRQLVRFVFDAWFV